MITATLTPEKLCGAMFAASKELSEVALGVPDMNIGDWRNGSSVAGYGSFVPLIAGSSAVNIGVLSDHGGCDQLARMLLDMGDGEEITQEDVTDAMGEVANILAGAVKTALNEDIPDLKIGLPIVVEGQLMLADNLLCLYADSVMGSVNARLLLILENTNTEE